MTIVELPRRRDAVRGEFPHNDAAEQGLLGALMIDNRLFERLPDGMKPEHFYIPVHQRIFSAISMMIGQGRRADPIALKLHFADDPDLIHVGGAAYLADLLASVVTVSSAQDYAVQIVDLFKRREIIFAIDEARISACEMFSGSSADEIAVSLEERLYAAQDATQSICVTVEMPEALSRQVLSVEKAALNQGQVTGVPFGIRALDEVFGGLHPGELTIVGVASIAIR